MSFIQKFLLNYVVRTIFERIPVLKTLFGLVNGKKTLIGRALVYVSLMLYFLGQAFPEIPHIDQANLLFTSVIGYVFEQLGIAHRVDKEAREQILTDEFEIQDTTSSGS